MDWMTWIGLGCCLSSTSFGVARGGAYIHPVSNVFNIAPLGWLLDY